MKIMSVVGARPNFMKIAPFVHELARHPREFEHCLVHTGQHYDRAMSQNFFKTLRIPRPDVDLGIGSGSHAEQVGRTMIAFEQVVRDWKPDWVVVVGDVNATCACSITAVKEHARLAHIEAGLRSFDRTMPEEINRMVTDRLSDLLLTPDRISDANLLREGAPRKSIKRVGNIMIDTLDQHVGAASRLDINRIITANAVDQGQLPRHSIAAERFAVLTLHRPSNVDEKPALRRLVQLFSRLSCELPIVWTLHPRTRKQLEAFGLWPAVLRSRNLVLVQPLDYLDMLKLNTQAKVMITDSGGLQEECCVLGTPCITMRDNTERPVTLVKHGGTSRLAGNDPTRISRAFHSSLNSPRSPFRPPLWDGRTSERIVDLFTRL
ncbi:MAG: UDP-N-acetylglucosamine 2-epimerase (non-hydrolyzing) [Verrucomicrobia bacterium]|nr:UDP-N-acetylglucosamine 2-epimerase (non-hydrolyzing) [Verrucomicrobiota bacterium]